ncbi:hypothetical protein G7054_g2621 [Neopestalotiopsis clavispora]|nr:hypothetical protein G7054_g2621 [Neopestalotiopsis clavispora]
MAGHFRASPGEVSQLFPARPQFSGFMKPCRFEGEVQNLEVQGAIPSEIDGTFYRVMPDPQFVPFIENDPWFNGDGNVSSFRIKDGKCSFKQKFVRTEKFVRERAAQKALLGKYRNKYTDAVSFKIRTTANTNVLYFNGRLLACKEDAPPYALHPETLETIGLEDFGGQLPSLTFTAHPKLDAKTKELVCFGYEAKGDGTRDGGEHWQWDSKVPFYLGVVPRRGAHGEDVKWFKAPNAFPGHTVNAYEEDSGKIVFDLPLTDKNVFFWWPDAEGNAPNPETIKAKLVRYAFDPHSSDLDLPPFSVLSTEDCEFPKIDDRFSMKQHNHSFFDLLDPKLGTNFPAIAPMMGGGHAPYNALGSLNHHTRELQKYFPGPTHLVQEPVFIPRSKAASEGDGWLMALVNNYATMSSELHIVDTADFSHPQAIILLPIRLRAGLHGNWIDAEDMEA